MHTPTIPPTPPTNQPDAGPWSLAALTRRALADLAHIARDLNARRRVTWEILLALVRQAALHRALGADLPPGSALAALRALPGLASWDLWADYRSRWAAYGDEVARGIAPVSPAQAARAWEAYRLRQRRLALAAWLARHDGDAPEAIVCAAEQVIAARLTGRGAC